MDFNRRGCHNRIPYSGRTWPFDSENASGEVRALLAKGVVPDKVIDGGGHILYLWTVPLKKEPEGKTE